MTRILKLNRWRNFRTCYFQKIGGFTDYFGVLKIDQVADGFYVSVGHGGSLWFKIILVVFLSYYVMKV